MIITRASRSDVPAWLALAAQVESLFGPMVEDLRFVAALERNIDRGSAYCVRENDQATDKILGGLMWSAHPPDYEIGWLAVADGHRDLGIGRLLVRHALSLAPSASVVTVTTFAPEVSGGEAALRFYERLGFVPSAPVPGIPADRQRLVYRGERPHVHPLQWTGPGQ